MTERDKRKKAALIAVAYYLQQEADIKPEIKVNSHWAEVGKELNMETHNRQRRGHISFGS